MASVHGDESAILVLCAGLFYEEWPGQDWVGLQKRACDHRLVVWQGNDGILYFPLLSSTEQLWLSLSRQCGPCVLVICPGTR